VSASFEAAITINNQIQQAANDLSTNTHILAVVQRAEVTATNNRVLGAIIAGVDASMAPQNIAIAPAAVGDRVVCVLRITDANQVQNVTAAFEPRISVAGQIVQLNTDLSAAGFAQLVVYLQRGDHGMNANGVEFLARGYAMCGVGTGADATMAAQAIALGPATSRGGATVNRVIRKETGQASTDQSANFEATISVPGQVQQTAANLTNHEVVVLSQEAL
jgi:hypothetical protein